MNQFETYNFNYSGYNMRFWRNDNDLNIIQVNVYNRNVDGHSLASFLPVSEESYDMSLKQLRDSLPSSILNQLITEAEDHFSRTLDVGTPENPPE
jgi:hypothetical protein